MDATLNLASTLLLTLLMLVGLGFFIRGSVKDRTEQWQFTPAGEIGEHLSQIQAHLEGRAYHILKVDPQKQMLIFQGWVQPSGFLTVFLTILSAIGLACAGLVINQLLPSLGGAGIALVLLAPVAGGFYRSRASRRETLRVEVQAAPPRITVTGHRDELAILENQLASQIAAPPSF